MREKICLDKGWYCHLNDIPMLPKTVTNEGSICGLAGPLESESKEPYSGGLQHLQRMLFNWQAFGYTIEAETPYKAVLKSKGLEMPETMAEMEGWFPVDLPHDFRLDFGYNRQDAQAAQGHFPEGVAWYRKTFPLSQEDLGSRIVIEIDGAMRGASVWFNGCFVGDHYSGYCGFQYDLTELAKYGEEGLNVLLIRLDTTIGPEGWWYEGGGLYRHVWLTKTAPIHVGRWGVHVQSQPQGADAKIRIHTTVDNDTDTSALVQLKTSILSPEGELIILEDAQGEVQGLESGVLHQQCQILKYHPWDVEDPALYTVRVEVLTQQGLQDVYEVPFGIRHIEYTKEGLMLNGRHLKIQGACVHLDWAGVGIAQHDAINEYKIKRLKEMGCNAYRSSHNAATIELLEACDR